MSAGPAPARLRCRRLEVGFDGRAILPPIDAELGRGQLVAVVGRNGSGKTTFFRTLLGLLAPVGGEIAREVPSARVAYVPQRHGLDPSFPLSVRDVVRMGTTRGTSFLVPTLREPPIVASALREAGVEDLASASFGAISEGQRQRVLLARLLASEPDLAVLDEPTAAMDVVAERAAFQLLRRLATSRGTTVVIVSHYLGVARDAADLVLLFDREGKSVVVGPPTDVFGHAVFRRSYGDPDEVCAHG